MAQIPPANSNADPHRSTGRSALTYSVRLQSRLQVHQIIRKDRSSTLWYVLALTLNPHTWLALDQEEIVVVVRALRDRLRNESSLFESRSFGAITCAQDVDSKRFSTQMSPERNFRVGQRTTTNAVWSSSNSSYTEPNPGADPNDVLDAKTFIYDVAHGVNGKYGDIRQGSVNRGDARSCAKVNGAARIDLSGEVQLNVFTLARVGEYIESSARTGTNRGLRFKDLKFGVFRNEHGNAKFAMQVVKDTKGMTFTPNRVYTSSPRQAHAGHMMTGSPENYYRPRNLGTDGQAAYFGDAPLSLVNDLFRAMTLPRNLELHQSLPAEKQHELESSAEFTEDLQAQKRKLISETQRMFQQNQVRNFSEENGADDCDCRRAVFDLLGRLIPLRSGSSKRMFAIDRLRGGMGRAALHDLDERNRSQTWIGASQMQLPEVKSWQPRAGDMCTVASARVSGSVMDLPNFASCAANGSRTRRVEQLIVSLICIGLPNSQLMSPRPNFTPNSADVAVSRPSLVVRPRAKAYQWARKLKAVNVPRPSPKVPRRLQIFARDAVSSAGHSLLDSEQGWQAASVSRYCATCPYKPKKESTAKTFMDLRFGQEHVLALQSPWTYSIDNLEHRPLVATKPSSSPTPLIDQTLAAVLKHSPSPWSPQIHSTGLASPATCSSEDLLHDLRLKAATAMCQQAPSWASWAFRNWHRRSLTNGDSFAGNFSETGHAKSNFYSNSLELNSFNFDEFSSSGLYFEWSNFSGFNLENSGSSHFASNSFNNFNDFSNFSIFSTNHFSNGSGLPSFNLNASMPPPPISDYPNDFSLWKHGYGSESYVLQLV
ncbi:hypothetical protein BDR22DRAFT_889228 [Usnea florida]